MNRGYLTNHLMNNECSPIEELDVEDVSQMWKNNINGEMCYIPYEDELALTTHPVHNVNYVVHLALQKRKAMLLAH